MLKLITLAIGISSVVAGPKNDALDDDLIASVNSISAEGKSKHSWKAGRNSRFEGMTLDDAKKLLGVPPSDAARALAEAEAETDAARSLRGSEDARRLQKRSPTPTRTPSKASTASRSPAPSQAAVSIPADFDARTAFPACAGTIGRVRDQGGCGSCWAYSSAEVIEDRLCTQSAGADASPVLLLSTQEITSCANSAYGFASAGCNGGWPSDGFKYAVTYGVVTGGDAVNTAGSSCYPYTATTGTCAATSANAGGTASTCRDVAYTAATFKADKRFPKYFRASNNVISEMQRAIVRGGSIATCFTVYNDFYAYTSGVYAHTSTTVAGGHAVKLIGWGTEGGLDYWLAVNSWGTGFGMGGLFKIRRGTNEGSIESYSASGCNSWVDFV